MTEQSTPNLFDTFEIWLQGRINTCVGGLTSRLEYTEDCASGLLQRIDALEKLAVDQAHEISMLHEVLNKLAERVQAMLVPQTMDADALLTKIRSSSDWAQALAEVTDMRAFDRALENAVGEAINQSRLVTMSDVTEVINDSFNDSGFADSVKDVMKDDVEGIVKEVIGDMSFEVTVR